MRSAAGPPMTNDRGQRATWTENPTRAANMTTLSGRRIPPPTLSRVRTRWRQQIDEWLWHEARNETADGDALGNAAERHRDFRRTMVDAMRGRGTLTLSANDRSALNDILFGQDSVTLPAGFP